MTISGNNSYTGGTFISYTGNSNSPSVIRADSNNALGTGVVQLNNTNAVSVARIEFRSATPTIGSLSSSGAGSKELRLGNTGVNTALTVNQTANGTFGGVISEFTGQTGSLTKAGSAALTLSGNNTYSGGTFLSAGTLIVNSNASLGAVAGALTFSGNGTLQTSAGFSSARNYVINSGVVGTINTANSTTLTHSGVISGAGSLLKSGGNGTLSLGGVNTFTGNTEVNAGTLSLISGGELRFNIANAGSNRVLGSGIASFDGLFRLNISGLTASEGTWNLVDVSTLTESFGTNFSLAFVGGPTFTNAGSGVYTSGSWTFTAADGNLVLVPEPSTWALLGLSLTALVVFRRRRTA